MTALFFSLIAGFLTIGVALVMSADNTLTQIELIELTHNKTSFSDEVIDKFQQKRNTASYYLVLGFVVWVGTTLFMGIIYLKIKR